MFSGILEKLVKRLEESNLIFSTKIGVDDGYDKVISLVDMLDLIQRLDDEERERIIRLFAERQANQEHLELIKKVNGGTENGMVDRNTKE